MPPRRHVRPGENRPSLDELLQITKLVNEQFRVERGIVIAITTAALLIALCAGAVAVWSHDLASCKDILFGSGGACTLGVASLFYMYNRSLIFMERMAAVRQEGGGADE